MVNSELQKTDWYKDNPKLTIGGVLKQGETHPAYKDAMDIVNKEKAQAAVAKAANNINNKVPGATGATPAPGLTIY